MSPSESPRAGTVEPGSGVAIPIARGERLRIANIEGGQVVDAWAVNPHDQGEYLSMEHTRVALSKLVPQLGDDLYSCRRRPMLTLVEDTSPGIHDTLLAACDAERYRLLGVSDWHANCSENYVEALAAYGLSTAIVPGPLNLFMNIPWQPDGSLSFERSLAAAGDYVTVAAVMDAVVVLSVCPQDLTAINAGAIKSIGYERMP